MKRRVLGRTGIEVSEVGIGTWELAGDVWGKKEDATSRRALLTGLENGANLIDTAAGYGSGHVEELIGGLFADHTLERSAVVVTTKVKPKNSRFAPPANVCIEEAYPSDWIVDELHNSLRRLATDYVDVLFMHTWSRAWDHSDMWFNTMEELKKSGKVRAIGISVPDEGAPDANTHIEAGRVDAVQVVFNVFQQEPLYTLLPLAAKHNVGVLARSPFSSGAIVQDWTPDTEFEEGDWRGIWPKAVKENWLADQAEMSAVVKGLTEAAGLTSPAAALRFVLDTEAVSSVIPGSANPAHVAENMAASSAPRLSDGLRAALKELWIQGRLQGTYNGSI